MWGLRERHRHSLFFSTIHFHHVFLSSCTSKVIALLVLALHTRNTVPEACVNSSSEYFPRDRLLSTVRIWVSLHQEISLTFLMAYDLLLYETNTFYITFTF
ncbi:hypothetical protein ANANG_G00110030 [Anguilla anguilla]|uniref:Uncharacterized protein n=1 Tax=Anguilla anguilla TaxID=7936 RepID=A0A9D3RZD5_ANGAN|nr:hypothetical protein ANANG_G00110030 [Anguilla anguilla]